MQITAIGTVANSLPENEVILLTLLISKRYIPYTDLQRIHVITAFFCRNVNLRLKIKQCGFLIFTYEEGA